MGLLSAIAALQHRNWRAEGFTKVVVACNVPYIVSGVTKKTVQWEERGWRSAEGIPIVNADVWVDLLTVIGELEKDGLDVQFWAIHKPDNPAVELAEAAMEPVCFCFP